MSDRVFIFGAGMSRFAGFPLGNNLWHFLLNHVEIGMGAMEWIDAYLTSPAAEPAIGTEDLEWLLTQVQEGKLQRKIKPYSGNAPINRREMQQFFKPFKHLLANRRWTKVRLSNYYRARLIRRGSYAVMWANNAIAAIAVEIANAMILHHACIRFGGRHFAAGDYDQPESYHNDYPRICPCYQKYALRKQRKITEAFVRKMRPGDTIITFNYDSLVESLLWQAGKWMPRDGYGIEIDFHPKRSRLLRGRSARALQPSPIKILKAHGSANWLRNYVNGTLGLKYLKLLFDLPITTTYLPDQETLWRISDPDVLAAEGPDSPNIDQVILSPIYKKNYGSDPTLRIVWDQIERALQSASELTVVGYSLPKGDVDARKRIMEALRDNQRCKSVVIVAPSETQWPGCLSESGKTFATISQRFEEWVVS